MKTEQAFDIRAALEKAQKSEDWALARRLIVQLENEANQRAAVRDRRIQERRFTGEPPTVFGGI